MGKTIDLVAGARPNFMKLAPVVRALQRVGTRKGLSWRIVHTGQHYDHGMNDVFFEELGIPQPGVYLGVGSGTHGAQTARILERYEAHLIEKPPAATVVFGDVNSTVACALAAVKLSIPVVHVESGLRSFDRAMPEEINRMVTDMLSDLLFVSEPSGMENLKREGVENGRVRLVGNVMIDTLVRELPRALERETHRNYGFEEKGYALLTLHRPSNVDEEVTLRRILEVVVAFSEKVPVIFPAHPRTQRAISAFHMEGLLEKAASFHCMDPLPYHDNLCLMANAKVVLTDSGGMQEETTYLRVPCLTLRDNTERPVTLTLGTSRLVGNDPERIEGALEDVLHGAWPRGQPVPLWDGQASQRIADILLDFLG